MSDKDIEIKIATTADTTGAKEVEDSLKKVGEDSRQQNATEEILARGKALAWAQAADKIQQYGVLLRNLKSETSGLSEEQTHLANVAGEAAETIGGVVSAVGQGFAAGGPIGAILAGTVSGLGLVLKAANDADKAINSAEDASKRSVDYWRQLQNLKLKLPIADAAEEANRLLDEQLQKMIRNARVAESSRGLDQARQESAGADAVRSGSQTAQGAAAVNLATSVNNQVAAIQEKLEIAAKAQAKLQSDADKAAADAGTLAEGSKQQADKLAEAKALQTDANTAMENLAADRSVADNTIAKINEKGEQHAKEIQDAAFGALTQSAQQERDALKQEVDRLGTNASAGSRASLAILDQILADGQVRADEMAKYAEAQGRLNGMMEKSNAAVLQGFQASENNAAAVIRIIAPIIQTLDSHTSKLSGLEAQVQSLR